MSPAQEKVRERGESIVKDAQDIRYVLEHGAYPWLVAEIKNTYYLILREQKYDLERGLVSRDHEYEQAWNNYCATVVKKHGIRMVSFVIQKAGI